MVIIFSLFDSPSCYFFLGYLTVSHCSTTNFENAFQLISLQAQQLGSFYGLTYPTHSSVYFRSFFSLGVVNVIWDCRSGSPFSCIIRKPFLHISQGSNICVHRFIFFFLLFGLTGRIMPLNGNLKMRQLVMLHYHTVSACMLQEAQGFYSV